MPEGAALADLLPHTPMPEHLTASVAPLTCGRQDAGKGQEGAAAITPQLSAELEVEGVGDVAPQPLRLRDRRLHLNVDLALQVKTKGLGRAEMGTVGSLGWGTCPWTEDSSQQWQRWQWCSTGGSRCSGSSGAPCRGLGWTALCAPPRT